MLPEFRRRKKLQERFDDFTFFGRLLRENADDRGIRHEAVRGT
jgi:hypothetical protein